VSRKQKPRAKHGGGAYVALSSFALRSDSFASLSAHATKLLTDFLSRYNGFNNGDLSLTWKEVEKRHWKSRDTFNKALKELLDRGWIIKTRQGGLHRCNLFAVTLFCIDEARDKSGVSKYDPGIQATTSPPAGWFRDPPRPGVTIVMPNKGNR
jgi:hypothetical protein